MQTQPSSMGHGIGGPMIPQRSGGGMGNGPMPATFPGLGASAMQGAAPGAATSMPGAGGLGGISPDQLAMIAKLFHPQQQQSGLAQQIQNRSQAPLGQVSMQPFSPQAPGMPGMSSPNMMMQPPMPMPPISGTPGPAISSSPAAAPQAPPTAAPVIPQKQSSDDGNNPMLGMLASLAGGMLPGSLSSLLGGGGNMGGIGGLAGSILGGGAGGALGGMLGAGGNGNNGMLSQIASLFGGSL